MNQLALQIAGAATLAELQAANARLDAMVPALHDSGIHAARIAEIVSGLNAGLFARLWALLAPPETETQSPIARYSVLPQYPGYPRYRGHWLYIDV